MSASIIHLMMSHHTSPFVVFRPRSECEEAGDSCHVSKPAAPTVVPEPSSSEVGLQEE